MKSFKVREGKVVIDGILYGETQQPTPIMGKWGRIASISISGRQFFPLSGTFNDGTPVVDEPIAKVPKKSKSELKESNGLPTDESGKPIKKNKAGKFTLNPNR